MPTLNPEQFAYTAKIDRYERLQSGLRFGELTGRRLSAILKDNERGFSNDWADLAEYIARDPHVASIYHTRKIRVAGAKWVLEPADGTELSQRAVTECDKMLRSLPALKQNFLDLLDGIGVGFAVSEILWQPNVDRVRVGELRWVHQRRFVWDSDYKLRLTEGGARTRGRELPVDKFVIHTPKEQSGYPPRSGALQVCAWHWFFKRKATEWYWQTLERKGSPFMYGKYPPNMREEVREEFFLALKRMSTDHVGMVPSDAEVIVEKAGSEAQRGGDNPHATFMRVMDEQLSKAIIGATDITESGPNGARAAVEIRAAATLDPRMIHDGEQLWGTLQRDLLTPFLQFNKHLFGGLMPAVPRGRFLHRDVDFEITPEVAAAKAASLNEIRRAAGLPVIEGRDRPLLDEERGSAESSGLAVDLSRATNSEADAAKILAVLNRASPEVADEILAAVRLARQDQETTPGQAPKKRR